MKTNFTVKLLWQFTVIIMIFSVGGLNAQTSHLVEVSNNKYTPSEITIGIGDTVVWKNIEGYHNVNGDISVNELNPESFGNGTGYDWTYSFVFNIAGVYEYQCDPHVFLGMFGKITVSDITNSIENLYEKRQITLYPNPAKSHLNIYYSGQNKKSVQVIIYSLNGAIIKQNKFNDGFENYKLDVSDLVSGFYLMELRGNNIYEVHKFLKN